ncbi:hypothetical protein [Glutamicibacter sp. NPDC087673]|uniref:hypothetical protein n=1 Tax=Glutamicibacter sp. NPDC087673 TaxID=3363997 RepID=UPI0038023EDB
MATLTVTKGNIIGSARLEFALAAGEVVLGITRREVKRDTTYRAIAVNSSYPISASGNVYDYSPAYGVNMYRATISNGTTTTTITGEFTMDFTGLMVTNEGSNLRAVNVAALLKYSRTMNHLHVVHQIPYRSGPPLVKYMPGDSRPASAEILIGSPEGGLGDFEDKLNGLGALVIRRPSLSQPDIIAAVMSYVLDHAEPDPMNQDATQWIAKLTLAEVV